MIGKWPAISNHLDFDTEMPRKDTEGENIWEHDIMNT